MHLITGTNSHSYAQVSARISLYPGDVFNKSLLDMISEALNKTFNANDFLQIVQARGQVCVYATTE